MIEQYLDGTPCECDRMEREYTEEGKLLMECPIIKGRSNGMSRVYYESGAIYQETPIVKDRAHGVRAIHYLENETFLERVKDDPYHLKFSKWETPYVTGSKHGIEKGFFDSGVVALLAEWDHNRIISERLFHENGQLAVESPFEQGDYHGIVRIFFPSGQPYQEIPFVNGVIHGERIIHHRNEVFSQDYYTDDHFFDVPTRADGSMQRLSYSNGKIIYI